MSVNAPEMLNPFERCYMFVNGMTTSSHVLPFMFWYLPYS